MASFKSKIRQLDDNLKQIGTDSDNLKFRKVVEVALKEAAQTMKECMQAISDFNKLEVPRENKKQQQDQLTAFNDSSNILVRKLKDVGQKI